MIRTFVRDLNEDEFTVITVQGGWERITTSVVLRALLAADFEVWIEDSEGELIPHVEYQGE